MYCDKYCGPEKPADAASGEEDEPDAVVVAVGCYVQAGKEEALLDGSIDLAVGNNRKKDIVEILEPFLQRGRRPAGGNPAVMCGRRRRFPGVL